MNANGKDPPKEGRGEPWSVALRLHVTHTEVKTLSLSRPPQATQGPTLTVHQQNQCFWGKMTEFSPCCHI